MSDRGMRSTPRSSLFSFRPHLLSFVRLVRWLWPGWWLYWWYTDRFVRHDCDVNTTICRLDWIMERPFIGSWLDV